MKGYNYYGQRFVKIPALGIKYARLYTRKGKQVLEIQSTTGEWEYVYEGAVSFFNTLWNEVN